MKRILVGTLSLVLLLALLSGCAARQTVEEIQSDVQFVTEQVIEGAPKPLLMTVAETLPGCAAFEYRYKGQAHCFYAYDEKGNFYRVLWSDFDGLTEKGRIAVEYGTIKKLTYTEYPGGGFTPAYEITATHVSVQNYLSVDEDGDYIITLPESGQKVRFWDEQEEFIPFVTDDAVREAEQKIASQVAEYSDTAGYALQVTDDYLCLVAEVIYYLDEPDETVGCFDHEHLFFSERISSIAIKKQPESVCTLCGEVYSSVYYFGNPIPEDGAMTFTVTKGMHGILPEENIKELHRIYNDRERWTDDSVVDREMFCFDGYVHFALENSCGKMYFGYDDNVLYFDGYFTAMIPNANG